MYALLQRGQFYFMERYKSIRVITKVVKFNDYYGITYVDDKGFIVVKNALSKLLSSKQITKEQHGTLTSIYSLYLKNTEKIKELNKRNPRNIAQKYIGSKKIRNKVFELHGEYCLCCGDSERVTLDHVIPIHCGGLNEIENLQTLCKSCNSKKNTRTIDYRKVKITGNE